MTYRIVKNKIVICKNGVYFALTKKDFIDLKRLIKDISLLRNC